MVESDTARVSVLPVARSELPAVFLGKVTLDVIGLGVGPSRLRVDSEETLPALLDERGKMSCTVPGMTPDGGPMDGAGRMITVVIILPAQRKGFTSSR